MRCTNKDNPFREGFIVRHIGTRRIMTITSIANDGWCSGNIPGGGYHHSQFELVESILYKIYG